MSALQPGPTLADLAVPVVPAFVRVSLAEMAADFRRPAPEDWVTVKKNPARAVYRVESEDGQLYVKVFPVRSTWDEVKARLGGGRAEREAETMTAIAARGIRVPRALAWGEERAGGRPLGSWLVTAGIPAAKVSDVIRKRLRGVATGPDRSRRSALLQSLGDLAARMHEAGIYHRDFHAANLLVRPGWDAPGATPQLVLLDLHKARVGRRPARRERVLDLGKLFHGLVWDLTRTDLFRIIDAYAPDAGRRRGRLLASVLAAAHRLEQTRLASRGRHAVRDSSGFRTERDGAQWLVARRRFEARAVADAIAGGFGGGEGDAAAPLTARSFDGGRARLARRAWLAAVGLHERGLHAPRTAALAERRSGALRRVARGVLVLEREPERRSLAELVSPDARPASEPRPTTAALARSLGRFLARLHRAGVAQDDLALDGIGVRFPCDVGGAPAGGGPDPDRVGLLLLDLERLSFAAGPLGESARVAMLGALLVDARAVLGPRAKRAALAVLATYARRAPWFVPDRAAARALGSAVATVADRARPARDGAAR